MSDKMSRRAILAGRCPMSGKTVWGMTNMYANSSLVNCPHCGALVHGQIIRQDVMHRQIQHHNLPILSQCSCGGRIHYNDDYLCFRCREQLDG